MSYDRPNLDDQYKKMADNLAARRAGMDARHAADQDRQNKQRMFDLDAADRQRKIFHKTMKGYNSAKHLDYTDKLHDIMNRRDLNRALVDKIRAKTQYKYSNPQSNMNFSQKPKQKFKVTPAKENPVDAEFTVKKEGTIMDYKTSIRLLFEAVIKANNLDEGVKRDARRAEALRKRLEGNPNIGATGLESPEAKNVYSDEQRAKGMRDVSSQFAQLSKNASKRSARISGRMQEPHTKAYRRMVHGLKQGPAPTNPRYYPAGGQYDMSQRTPDDERRRASWESGTHGIMAKELEKRAGSIEQDIAAKKPKPENFGQKVIKAFGRLRGR